MIATRETAIEEYHPTHLKQNGINGVAPVPPRAKSVVGRHVAMTLAGSHMVDNFEQLEAMNPSLGRHVL